jgi:hypothetical protein
MAETGKCVTVSIGQVQITVTVNSIYVIRDGIAVSTIYRGEDITRYQFRADLTVSGGTPDLITMVIYLGKDQNSLVEIGRGSIPGYSGSFGMSLDGRTLMDLYGYKTTDDILNRAGVSTQTSCAYCVKIIW